MEIEAPRSLLVLKPSSFGDIVHTLPAVACLKAAWPACRISWLVNTEWMPLLADNPDVDEVIEFPRREFRGWGGGWKMAQWLRKVIAGRKPDLALDFQGLFRSAFIGRISGARVLKGLSDAREGARWFYDGTVNSPVQPVHAANRYLALAHAAISDESVRSGLPERATVSFPLPKGQPLAASHGFKNGFVLIHPYARGKHKSLTSTQIDNLLRKVRTDSIVLVGRGEELISGCVGNCLNLLNQTTLPELIWLMRRASFVVSVDSGPAHLAAALGKPMVAIHSWSDPRKVGPYRPDAWVWKNGMLTRVRDLAAMDASFFAPNPLRLRDSDIASIARLATSPSDFSA